MQAQAIPVPQPPVTPTPTPAAPPAPPALPGEAGPQAIYQAFRAQRRELERQLDGLEGKRRELSNQLRQSELNPADRAGLEARLAETDQRILALEKQIEASNLSISQAAAVPGAAVEPRPQPRSGPPEEVFVLGGLFMVIVLLPMSIAYARRIWRRGARVSQLPPEMATRLTTLEQGVDAIAVEVERIGEGQRYVTQLLNDAATSRLVGAGPAEPIPVRAREPVQSVSR